MQIRKKLPGIIIGLVCVPLLILIIGAYIYSFNRVNDKSKANIRQLTSLQGQALTILLDAKERQVQLLAKDSRVREAIEKGKTDAAFKVLEKTGKESDIEEILIIDQEGEILLSSNKSFNKITSEYKKLYQKVLQGETVFSQGSISNTSQNKVISITVPILNDQGKIIGGLCQGVFNDSLSEIINLVEVQGEGYSYIFDEKISVIADSNRDNEENPIKDSTIYKIINDAKASGKIEGNGTYTYLGKEIFISFYIVKDIDWTICIVQNITQIQQQAMMEAMFINLTIIVVIIGISILSILVTRKITNPISQLAFAMERTIKGNFNYYCPYNADDEVGALSSHYNQLLKKLGDSHTDFNRVSQELSAAQNELKINKNELAISKEAVVVSEVRYKTILNAIEEVIWEYNIQTKRFSATQKWETLVGTSSKNINIGEEIKKVLEPHYIESLMLSLESCIDGKRNIFKQELALLNQDNEMKWVLCKGYALKNRQGKVERLVGSLTDITANKTNQERVKELAFFDILTGCLNKNTFMETLDTYLSAEDPANKAALLFIDLDDFKRINDTLGHEMGDKLLSYVAKNLAALIPQDAFISRFGGDEFVICKPQVAELEQVQELVYSILSMFQETISIDQSTIHMSCSIGISIYPQDGVSGDVLLKNADTAMYKAKENGKNSYSFYVPAMSESLDRKLLVESALREAISKNALMLQYQPIVDIHSEKTVAAEALLRLNDQTLGHISPAEFIPIAEETGLIIPSGDWVIENTLRELSYYRLVGYENFSITINVSSLQMKNRSFLPKLKLAVQSANIPPEFIKLEVTESVLMEDIEKSIELFKEIKQIGMKLALDDFGTGYSSLNYLRSIPIDILKIDKSFIDEITTSQALSDIVDSIIDMAHALKVQVVAEGVETKEQLDLLKEKGCDLIQGYYFSKPLLANQLEERLEKEKDI